MILIVDFGSQFTEVLHRVVRDSGVRVRVIAASESGAEDLKEDPTIAGVILSGGPHSVYQDNAPGLDPYWLEGRCPVLGICYGMQLIAHLLGGQVTRGVKAEYGPARLECHAEAYDYFPVSALSGQVWMSHGDHVSQLPAGFQCFARSTDALIALMAHPDKKLFGIQFHPEVVHSENGRELIQHFVHSVCLASPLEGDLTYTPKALALLQERLQQLGTNGDVICALSGGVDSTVAATLVSHAIGDKLHCVFVDTGLLRQNEFDSTLAMYREKLKLNVHAVNASELFLERLRGVREPEQKRKIIGSAFIDVFERESKRLNNCVALVQGTIASDVIESSHSSAHAHVIKSHHNVGGLPERMNMKLIEPLRHLFKDEVRALGRELEIPEAFVGRHPFPGPGLALRILGDITTEKLDLLRQVDAVLIDQLHRDDLYNDVWQAFAVLLPVKSVGVKGDGRSYDSVVALRCVGSKDGMTADWSRLPLDFLANVSRRITNEVAGVSRVVYDITSKPPATIEWE